MTGAPLDVEQLKRERDEAMLRAERAEAEVERLNQEVMAHQLGDGYQKGHEHGSQLAAQFKKERDEAQALVARLGAALAQSVEQLQAGSTLLCAATAVVEAWAELRQWVKSMVADPRFEKWEPLAAVLFKMSELEKRTEKQPPVGP